MHRNIDFLKSQAENSEQLFQDLLKHLITIFGACFAAYVMKCDMPAIMILQHRVFLAGCFVFLTASFIVVSAKASSLHYWYTLENKDKPSKGSHKGCCLFFWHCWRQWLAAFIALFVMNAIMIIAVECQYTNICPPQQVSCVLSKSNGAQ